MANKDIKARWKKGQSGNPKGSEAYPKLFAPILRKLLLEKVPDDPKRRSYAELVCTSLMKQALEGNIYALRELFERIDGKIPQPQEISGQGGVPLILEIREIQPKGSVT